MDLFGQTGHVREHLLSPLARMLGRLTDDPAQGLEGFLGRQRRPPPDAIILSDGYFASSKRISWASHDALRAWEQWRIG